MIQLRNLLLFSTVLTVQFVSCYSQSCSSLREEACKCAQECMWLSTTTDAKCVSVPSSSHPNTARCDDAVELPGWGVALVLSG